MDFSPPFSSSTPRTGSPLLDDDDLLTSVSPSPSPVPSLSRPTYASSYATPDSTESKDEVDSRRHNDSSSVGAMHSSTDTASRQLKGKEKARVGPLKLLDLPVDILKEIIQQLPHTNDLTSLALCHSALHRLAIPYIYSRFDIVWPDESTHTEPRSGVDALTYGLATLVTGDDCFPHQNRSHQSNLLPHARKAASTPYPIPRRRFGNYYAQFTKKFSLGNGPAAWVQEYMITKEGGKMLGTLVALALARMINLETFIWDMPTGVLRDVWLALSSQADRTDGDTCRLDRLWIRWHDNTLDVPLPPPAPPMILNTAAPPGTTHPSGVGLVQPPVVLPQIFHAPSASAMDRVEYPTFSVIPPLKSLSVLDIDELPYLDEMSILIARSQNKLRELRIGIAPHAQQRDWVTAWEGDRIQQVDYNASWIGASSIGEKRLGGVLGILVARVHNLRHTDPRTVRNRKTTVQDSRQTGTASTKIDTASMQPTLAVPLPDRDPEISNDETENTTDGPAIPEGVSLLDGIESFSAAPIAHATEAGPLDSDGLLQDVPPLPALPVTTRSQNRVSFDLDQDTNALPGPELTGKLRLEVLELERVPLSVPVLLRAFDWTIMTTLTLLNCNNHEQLWKSLRRNYTPRTAYTGSPASSKAYKASYTLRSEYTLNLKKIHTNTVSPSLISFLKETLAPNTLEVLFLQEGRSYQSTVTVEAIYRGPLRRHRSSLKKLMIDSSEKSHDGHATTSLRWRRWMLSRDILTFITSGRMSSLRELAVAIDYKDWHHFLQRLPLIPHIRSLYIPFIADHPHGNNLDPREYAYQILDIVHLRPEIELCYMGLSNKCFEILENRLSNYDLRHDGMHVGETASAGYVAHDPIISDDESEATEDEDEDEDELDDGMGADGDETESEASDEIHDYSDDESLLQDSQKGPKLRVREILFYEERVEAFRRRHGVLRP
ncbi:unnamed protein product [Periconia digitata]|uniref:F-box domain-containing protein n=1 Tax=Periconia digitata TaxID=1303443 RepID=A0A9W4XY08_9PLEO|nr:unnamed protein product [Periconia digitata]